MTGDGESQPVESVDSLDDLANALAPETKAPVDEAQRTAPESDEADEDEQEVEDTEESDDEAEDDAEEPTFTIKVDGKDVNLKQSELVELRQKGTGLHQKDDGRGGRTQGGGSRSANSGTERPQAARRGHASGNAARLEAFTKFMETQVGTPPMPHVGLRHRCLPQGGKEQYEARKGQLQQAYAAQQQIEQEQARQRQAWIKRESSGDREGIEGHPAGLE
jgi:hypothetical protein